MLGLRSPYILKSGSTRFWGIRFRVNSENGNIRAFLELNHTNASEIPLEVKKIFLWREDS